MCVPTVTTCGSVDAASEHPKHDEHDLTNKKNTSDAIHYPPRLFCQPARLSSESYSLLILVCSALFYSIMATFVKLAVATGIPSTELVFLRAVFQGILVVLAMFWFRADTNHSGRQGQRLIWIPFGSPEVRNVVVARGMVGGLGFLLYYYTIGVLPLGDATTLLSLNPIITVMAASIFLGEPIRMTHIVAAVVSMIGCVLIAKPSFLFGSSPHSAFDKDQHSSIGYITALMGAGCGAAVYILIRRAGKGGVHTLQLLFSWVTFGIFFSILVGVLLPLLSGQGFVFVWPSSRIAWGYVWGVCTVGSLAHLLMNYAARHAPAGLASVVRSSGILWSYALELAVFRQVPQHVTMAGAALIVVSLATIAIEKHQENHAAASAAASSRQGGGLKQHHYTAVLAKDSSSSLFQEEEEDETVVLPMEKSTATKRFQKPTVYGSVNV